MFTTQLKYANVCNYGTIITFDQTKYLSMHFVKKTVKKIKI